MRNVGAQGGKRKCRTVIHDVINIPEGAFAGQTDTHSQIDVIKEVHKFNQMTVDLT